MITETNLHQQRSTPSLPGKPVIPVAISVQSAAAGNNAPFLVLMLEKLAAYFVQRP